MGTHAAGVSQTLFHRSSILTSTGFYCLLRNGPNIKGVNFDHRQLDAHEAHFFASLKAC